MIQRQSHSTVYVTDQDESLVFYRDRLGFEVRTDTTLDGFRWLTVSPKGQPDLEVILMDAPPEMRGVIEKGVFGIGVFETDDIHGDYERLRKEGIEFVSPPEEKFYGTEAIVKDNSGNWFSLTQREK